MEGQRSRQHWLNPLFRSETESSESTKCSSKSAPLPTSTEASTYQSQKDMKRLMGCISQSWKTIKSMPSASSFVSRDDKEIVMEGYLPTTKRSLLNFLKGMGLKPKVDIVGKETIITADASQIRDAALKQRFIKFMKKQVIDTPHSALTEASSTSVASSASSKASSASSEKSKCSSEPSKDSSRTSQSSEPSNTGHTNKGKTWNPPKELEDTAKKGKKKSEKKKNADPSGDTGKQDKKSPSKTKEATGKEDKKSPSKTKEADDVSSKKDDKKKGKSVGFKTVGMVPVVEHVENPFERQIPVGAHITITNEEDQLNESQNVYNQHPYGGPVWYEMHKACSLTRPQSVQDQPSCQDQLVMTAECHQQTNNQKKKKKLRIVKHLRKWFSKKKDIGQTVPNEISKDNENLGIDRQNCAFTRESCDLYPICQFQTVSVAPEPDLVPVISKLYTENKQGRQRNGIREDGVPVTAKLYVDPHHQRLKKNKKSINKRPMKMKINPQAFDGSISMPVLITPNQSCFKTKQEGTNLLEASKSSTLAAENCQAQDSYSVVGDSAAIHIGKKRIRLEGEDVKYGSILHKDKDFDEHFRVLKENSLSDIENQVRKVKERIMFARAVGAVGDRLPEGAPKVDYKELLMPKKNHHEKRTIDRRSHVDVATTSSFYQKFLASMNILKTTHRFDACDRSVMTDEPLSKTYAEFINTMNERNSPRQKSPSVSAGRSRISERSEEGVSTGDSAADLQATSYLKMICNCWEPIFRFLPASSNVGNDEQHRRNRRPPENTRTEEEKILKCIVDKVLDCSRNKKGYIRTEIKSP